MTEGNVYQRFNVACSIIADQKWVKDMENKQYKSIPIDDMRAGVRRACVQAGIVHVGPYDIECEKTVTDSRTFRYYGSCKFRYVNADKPDEFIEFESMGEAMDNGDKGVGKFITNLIKNHYKAAFDIGENGKDDVDAYSNEELYDEAARIQNKRARVMKQASNDSFWGGKDTKIEAEEKANIDKAEQCRAAIKEFIRACGFDLPDCLTEYATQYGKVEDWDAGIAMRVYKELVADGHKLREVAL